jgi:hypothetical protein
MITPFDRRILWAHWQGDAVRDNSIESLAASVRRGTPGAAGLVIKTSHGAQWQGVFDQRRALAIDGPGDIQRWVHVLNEHRLETHLWSTLCGEDVIAESDRVIAACQVPGVRTLLLQIESGTARVARQLITRIRAAIPAEFHLGLLLDLADLGPIYTPMQEWLPYVQSLHPMIYHWDFSGGREGPEVYVDDAFGALAVYGLPVVPMLQTYPAPEPVPEMQVYQAGQYAFAKGAVGLTFFRYGGECATPPILAGINRIEIPAAAPDFRPAQRIFQVQAARLRVRSAPSLKADTVGWLATGDLVEALADSRTEADGYLWWQSAHGWQAQGRADFRQVLMIEVTPNLPPYGLPLLADALVESVQPPVPQKRFRVRTDRLSVRSQPEPDGEFLLDAVLNQGSEILVDADAWMETNGFRWWFHGAGWSAETSLETGLQFLQDLTPEIPRAAAPPVDEPGSFQPPDAEGVDTVPAPNIIPRKLFRVLSPTLHVRSQPSLGQRASSSKLRAGQEIDPRADAWREADGYVWWQHGAGWSVERTIDGRQRFLLDLNPEVARIETDDLTRAPTPRPTVPRPGPRPDELQRFRVVALGVTIRDEPNSDAIRVGRLRQGEELLLSDHPSYRVEADGFVWRRHEQGWSAERSLDGKEEYLLSIDALPLLGQLIRRHPVRLEEIDWVQYYGNTSFAQRYGIYHNYHRFSQGLHSGLDYGVFSRSAANPPIFAGLEGLFAGRGLKYGPNRVDVLVGDYRIIYGHIGRPVRLPRQALVKPDTVMGVIENSRLHLHLEVRYRDRYILNPLLLMPPDLADEFISRFPPEPQTFVRTDLWQKWLTPYDQPVIRLGGEVIGPTA